MHKTVLLSASVLSLAASVATVAPAYAATAGVKVGVLSCNVDSGFGFILGSSRDIRCNYVPNSGGSERYTGTITRIGVDIGYIKGGVLIWTVVAPSSDVKPGALAGQYGGVTAGATVGVGLGANALIGGFNKSVALQPLSIEGTTGLNVAAGVAGLTLTAEKR
jgi:Protein of unknown function (DUF992)